MTRKSLMDTNVSLKASEKRFKQAKNANRLRKKPKPKTGPRAEPRETANTRSKPRASTKSRPRSKSR